jgi:hypothetical protein
VPIVLLAVVTVVSKSLSRQAGETMEYIVQLSAVDSGSLRTYGGRELWLVRLPLKPASSALPLQKVVSGVKSVHSTVRVVLPLAERLTLRGVSQY